MLVKIGFLIGDHDKAGDLGLCLSSAIGDFLLPFIVASALCGERGYSPVVQASPNHTIHWEVAVMQKSQSQRKGERVV